MLLGYLNSSEMQEQGSVNEDMYVKNIWNFLHKQGTSTDNK